MLFFLRLITTIHYNEILCMEFFIFCSMPHPNIGCFLLNQDGIGSNPNAMDKKLALYCKKYGELGCSFITYPLGGMLRCYWKPNRNERIPPIHLPDLQLGNNFWQKYINCALSEWIDPDSEDLWLAKISAIHFDREIEYARYLGISSVIVRLKHANSPNLAQIVRKHLLSRDFPLNFWFLLPTNTSQFDGLDGNNCWLIWRNFRTLSGNSKHLHVGLCFTQDLDDEFTSDYEIQKWLAEPLVCLLLDHDLFLLNDADTSKLKLTSNHAKLFTSLLVSNKQYVMVSSQFSQITNAQIGQIIGTIEDLFKSNEALFAKDDSFTEYFDVLQTPLQPLTENLGSCVYQTFEQDKTKYEHYQKAITAAISDLVVCGYEEIVLIVLGAGRGPLVTASIQAGKLIKTQGNNFSLSIYAVEKNPNALLTLEYCNEECWDSSVKIIDSDMRLLEQYLEKGDLKRPDIVNFIDIEYDFYPAKIVSELLGSFGDNELSPECLDGVNNILKESSICIPQRYRNFIAPIQSIHMYQNIAAIEDKSKAHQEQQKFTDLLYVVCLDQFCYLDEPKACFEFVHPNKMGASNTRTKELEFKINPYSELMGFAGHFEVVLYKDIILSTHPLHHTEKLYSWFSALFPLRELFLFEKQTMVVLNISRKLNENSCWYEWFIKYKTMEGELMTSETQNLDGRSQAMKLF